MNITENMFKDFSKDTIVSNDVELLSSRVPKEFNEELRKEYEWIKELASKGIRIDV